MPKKGRRQQPPVRIAPLRTTPDLLVLDRFNEHNLRTWAARSVDIDQLHRLLYFVTEPERRKHRGALLEALNEKPAAPETFMGWVRIVDHRWTLQPLSAGGSLRACGGRFNVGADVDESMHRPYPALYIGEDYETAHREYFQQKHEAGKPGGLSPEELNLNRSFSAVRVSGHIERVVDVSDLAALAPVCKIWRVSSYRTASMRSRAVWVSDPAGRS